MANSKIFDGNAYSKTYNKSQVKKFLWAMAFFSGYLYTTIFTK